MEEKEKRKYFTRVSSVTLEHLSKTKLTPNEWRTVMALFRKTYGYQKTHDRISFSQFELMTGLEHKRQVCALQSLERKRIIIMEPGQINTYSLNKNYAEWVVAGSPLAMTTEEADKLVAFRSQLVAPAGQLLVAGPPHTIDNTIDNLQGSVDLQILDLNNTLLADARLGTVVPLVSTAEAVPVSVLKEEKCSSVPVPAYKPTSYQTLSVQHPEGRPYQKSRTLPIVWMYKEGDSFKFSDGLIVDGKPIYFLEEARGYQPVSE